MNTFATEVAQYITVLRLQMATGKQWTGEAWQGSEKIQLRSGSLVDRLSAN